MAKKFKPIAPKDLPEDLKKDVTFITDNWMTHPVVTNFHGRWEEYIAWFEGNQYTYYSETAKQLIDISDKVDREIKNVYNRILPMIRQMWGEIRYPHNFYVDPNTLESEDIKASKIGSHFLAYTNSSSFGKFNQKLNMAKLWAIITGNCFWKEWWNKNLSGYAQGEGGKGITKESGNFDFNYVNPFNVRPDPLAKTREGWRWFTEGKLVAKSAVEQEFDLAPGSLPTETMTGARRGLFERRKFEYSTEDQILRLEHWKIGEDGRKNGRFMVVAGGWLCDDRDSPAPEAQIPYFQIPGILPILNEQWYDSAVRIVQHPQRQFNRLGSMVDGHISDYRPKALITRGSLGIGEFERFTRAGVDYIIVNPGLGEPHWQNPPPLPELILSWHKFMENELETESSVRKVSLGQLPKYAQRASGVLFEGLKRQDEAVLIPTVEDINTSLEDAMKFRLQLAQKHLSIKRMVKITGKNRRSVLFFEGAELRDNTDVKVKEGVELFSDKEAKRNVVDSLVQKNYIKDTRQALELLDVKGLEEYMEEEFIDENQAYRENDTLLEGKITPKADEDDNHEVHFRIHNNKRKEEDFAAWSKDAQDKLFAHTKEHKDFMAEAAVPVEGAAAPVEEEVAPEIMPPAMGAPAMGPGGEEEGLTPEEIIAIMSLGGEGGY